VEQNISAIFIKIRKSDSDYLFQ